MAVIDYWGIENAIKEAFGADSPLAGTPVQIEEEVNYDEGPSIFIYLVNRDALDEDQPIAAGRRLRQRLEFSIWCYAVAMDVSEAAKLRDDLLGKAEVALMRDPTLGDTVAQSWITGGRFQNARDDQSGFFLGAEIRLIADVTASY